MSKNFDATINSGVYLILLGDSGVAERDEFAKTYLTRKGQDIYAAISPRAAELKIRAAVTRAVGAGY